MHHRSPSLLRCAAPRFGARLVGLALLLFAASGCGEDSSGQTRPTGLTVTELVAGHGEPLADGDYAALHYDARIARVGDQVSDAPPYDSTRSGEPFLFKLGTTHLLPGFAEGVRGLREGGRRRLLLPPELAHGAIGRGKVPPDAWLEYDVELVARFQRGEQGLQYRIVAEGEGEPAQPGQSVAIEQRSFVLETGRTLSETKQLGSTLGFKLGEASMIEGLARVLPKMRPKSRWQIALPPALAFGPLGIGWHLLPGQELLMDVELVRVERR